jgi:hypothetical protein
MDENLAAQAELALEVQGNYQSLCYGGQWHTNGETRPRRFSCGGSIRLAG